MRHAHSIDLVQHVFQQTETKVEITGLAHVRELRSDDRVDVVGTGGRPRPNEAPGRVGGQELLQQVGTAEGSFNEISGFERKLAVTQYPGDTQRTVTTSTREPPRRALDEGGKSLPSEPPRHPLVAFGEAYAFVRRVPREQLVAAIAAENHRDVLAGELRDVIRRQRRWIAERLVEVADEGEQGIRQGARQIPFAQREDVVIGRKVAGDDLRIVRLVPLAAIKPDRERLDRAQARLVRVGDNGAGVEA